MTVAAMKRVMTALGLVLLSGAGSRGLAAETGGFFSCPEIVFFGPCATAAPPAPTEPDIKEAPVGAEAAQKTATPPSSKPKVEESIWAEPVRGPDGQLRVYLPPQRVRDFLEKPTAENARAYLEWNRLRM